MTATWLALCVAGYLAGSIPVGFLIARARGIDIRTRGSGNIGATNVGRVLGKRLGITCFIIDVAKGLLPVLGAGIITGALDTATPAQAWWLLAVATSTIIGHMFPVWLKFKGGKGVATGLGAMLAVFPVVTIAAAVAAIVWIISLKLTRYVSMSSCLAAISLPITTLAQWNTGRVTTAHLVVTGTLALLVVFRHRANIGRVVAGTEPKVGQRKRTATEPEVSQGTTREFRPGAKPRR